MQITIDNTIFQWDERIHSEGLIGGTRSFTLYGKVYENPLKPEGCPVIERGSEKVEKYWIYPSLEVIWFRV